MKKTVKRLLIIMLTVLFVFTNCVGTNMTVSAATKKPTKITLNYQKKNMSVGETLSLNISKVKPANASKSVKWSTSDKKIATVTASGKVKAKKTGTVTITATSKSNSKVVAKCKIKVYKAATKITLNYSKKSMYVGNSLTLKVKSVKPSGALKNVTWKSSNKKIATVSASGKVSAKKTGTVTITATDKGNKKTKAKCKITITYKPTKTIKLNSESSYKLAIGEKVTLNAKVTNPKTGAQPIQWSSKDKTVAKVDSKGNVTAVSEGTTTIVATSGKKNVQVTITVYKDILVSTPTPAPTASPVPTATPLPTVTPLPEEDAGTYYNRAEWISVLADKMGYAITEESLNKDTDTGEIIYSYDDIYDNEHVLAIEAAVQNAVLNYETDGGNINYQFIPKGNVTREFAAMTVVRALGITTDSTLSCSDSEEIKYANEVQAAIESGMFALLDGAFIPDEKVTEEEFKTILQIADEILESRKIDLNHEDVIEYTDVVVEDTTQMEDYTVTVSDGILYVELPENEDTNALEVGQIILLPANEEYVDGVPVKIDSLIQKDGNVVVEGHVPETVTEVFEHVDIEGYGQFDIENMVLADGVTFVEEDSSELNLTKAGGEGELPISFEKKFEVILSEAEGVGKEVAYISLNIPEIKYKLDFTKDKVNEVLIEVPNTITAVYDVKAAWSGEKELGTIPIKLPAGFSVNIVVTVVGGLDGSIHLEYRLDNAFGIQYKDGAGIQKISRMDRTWKMELAANANLGVDVSVELNWMGGVKNKIAEVLGNEEIAEPLYTVGTEVGVEVNANTIARSEQELVCTDAFTFLYWNFAVGEDCKLSLIAPVLEHKWTIYDKDNSPLKSTFHFENQTKVTSCTYKLNKFKVLVTDENKNPLANVQLKFRSVTEAKVYKTDANGAVEGQLPSGDYTCSIVMDGYKAYSDIVTIKEGDTTISIVLSSLKSDASSSGKIENSEDDESGSSSGGTASILYSGTWYGMDWTIDEEGNLVISGEYVESRADTDSSWGEYRNEIKTAMVTAKNVKSVENWFFRCSNLTSVDLSRFDTSQVITMDYMFYGCSGLTSIDISGFDTSQVTSMGCMFYGCSGLTSIDISGFDTSQVTSMGCMFGGCSGLTSIDLNAFDTSRVTGMDNMFSGCSGLTSIDLSAFDTSQVTYMNGMFSECSGLTSIDLSTFDTSQVDNMAGMFSGCSGLTSIDLNAFDTSQVVGMHSMFYGCSGLTNIDISGFNTSQVTDMSWMFSDCSMLASIKVPLNVICKGVLPDGVWKDEAGNTYTYLPQSVTKSFVITKVVEE